MGSESLSGTKGSSRVMGPHCGQIVSWPSQRPPSGVLPYVERNSMIERQVGQRLGDLGGAIAAATHREGRPKRRRRNFENRIASLFAGRGGNTDPKLCDGETARWSSLIDVAFIW